MVTIMTIRSVRATTGAMVATAMVVTATVTTILSKDAHYSLLSYGVRNFLDLIIALDRHKLRMQTRQYRYCTLCASRSCFANSDSNH